MATLFIGQNKIFLPTVDSTNSYASSLLKNVNLHEGTVVYTHHQTHGRGQRGNSWNAEPAMNITLSVVLKPSFLSVQHSFYLSKITALAIHDVLTGLPAFRQFDIRIKWPNDILVDSKKIAGILIENSFKENHVLNCVTGIGLNVNQRDFDAVTTPATSMELLARQEFDTGAVMELLFSALEKWYLQLRQNNFASIDTSYLQRLYNLNVETLFVNNHGEFPAVIRGVDPAGLLLLETGDGQLRSFDIKDVKLVR